MNILLRNKKKLIFDKKMYLWVVDTVWRSFHTIDGVVQELTINESDINTNLSNNAKADVAQSTSVRQRNTNINMTFDTTSHVNSNNVVVNFTSRAISSLTSTAILNFTSGSKFKPSYCCLPTPMTLASGGIRSSACGPPASFSVNMARTVVSPAGSVHKSRGDNVVRIWVQLKR